METAGLRQCENEKVMVNELWSEDTKMILANIKFLSYNKIIIKNEVVLIWQWHDNGEAVGCDQMEVTW